MQAGSITFSTALDNEQLEKDLQSLTKKIEKKEREIAELTEKRDQAQKKGVFDAAVLDEEKAKLQELKDRLADLRNMSKDKSYDLETREGYAAQISDVKQALEDQRTRVNALQKEWNQTESEVERYTSKLAEAENELHRQQDAAGNIHDYMLPGGQRGYEHHQRHGQGAGLIPPGNVLPVPHGNTAEPGDQAVNRGKQVVRRIGPV